MAALFLCPYDIHIQLDNQELRVHSTDLKKHFFTVRDRATGRTSEDSVPEGRARNIRDHLIGLLKEGDWKPVKK